MASSTCHQLIQQFAGYVGDKAHQREFQTNGEGLVFGLHTPVNKWLRFMNVCQGKS